MDTPELNEILRELQHNVDAAHGQPFVKLSHNEVNTLVQFIGELVTESEGASQEVDNHHRVLRALFDAFEANDIDLDPYL